MATTLEEKGAARTQERPECISPEEARRRYKDMTPQELGELAEEADNTGAHYCIECGNMLTVRTGARYVKNGLMCYGDWLKKAGVAMAKGGDGRMPPMLT